MKPGRSVGGRIIGSSKVFFELEYDLVLGRRGQVDLALQVEYLRL